MSDDHQPDDKPDGAEIDVEKFRDDSIPRYGEDETQNYVDRDTIDFDPEDGLYSGTAVTGNSEIPDPAKVAEEHPDVDPTAASPSGGEAGAETGSEG